MFKLFTRLLPVLLLAFSQVCEAQVTIQIGTGTASTPTTTPSPANIYFRNSKLQILYRKSEINAAGITGPQILDQIQFNVTGLPLYTPLPNYTIKVKHFMGANLTAYDPGPFTQVYFTTGYTPTLGWNQFTFTTPFVWNDADNLLFEICWDLVNPNWNASGTVEYTATTSTMMYNWSDVTAMCPSATATDNSTYRPNIKMRFTPLAPCTGTPTAGTASVLNSCPTIIGLNNYTLAGNMSIQWQSKLSCATSWTNIAGATSASYQITTQSQPTQYRAYIRCNNNNLTDTSNILTLNSVTPCYCPSAAAYTPYQNITNVTFASINNTSTCTNTYTSFTSSVPPANLLKGEQYNFSMSTTNCGTFSTSYGVAVFIDFNRDGVFSVAERVFAPTTTYTGATFNVAGNITIPLSASTGITGMRIILAYNTAGNSITGCWNGLNDLYYYGETEDYLVNLQYAPNVTGTGLVNDQVTFCSGQNATLTASAPGISNPSFLWKKPNNAGWDTSATLTLNNLQTTQGGNYIAYVLTTNCPGGAPDTSAPRIISVTVNPTPGKPVVSPSITYCQGSPFDSIPIYGENLKWYTVATGGVAGPYPTINTSQPSTVTFYVSQTVDGCEGPRAPLTISVAPKPAPPQVTSPVGYCQGVPATPLIANGQNVRWYSTPSGGVGTPIAPTPSTQAQGTFTWYATQTIAGCESNRAPVVVRVSYLPNGLITLGRPFVCQYDTITIGYFGNALPDADYTWTLPEGAQIVSGTGPGPLVVRFDSFGTQRVRLVVDNGGCIGPEAFYDVPVQQSPRLTIDMPDNVCQGEIVNLAITYSTPGIDSFAWDFNGAEMVYGSMPRGPYGLRWNSSGDKTVTVIATDNTCKSQPSDDKITVRSLPDVSITASKTDVCAGDSIEFSVPFEQGASYQWLPHQFFGESNASRVWGVVDVAKEIKVNATSMYNCKATGSLWVGANSCCQVYFPTAFSPNGDGKNDLFRMLTVNKDKNAKTQAHQITTFRVANRWGQTVFETGDETTGWDGTFNGKPMDMGTYFFYVKYKCADGNFYEERGEVTLVR